MRIVRTLDPKDFDIQQTRHDDFTVVVLAVLPDNVSLPMIQDPRKPQPVYVKLPGGEGEYGESVFEAAQRELDEETGALVEELTLFRVEERVNYDGKGTHLVLYVAGFVTGYKDGAGLKELGDEGEIVNRFKQEELPELVDLFRPHRAALEEVGFLPTF